MHIMDIFFEIINFVSNFISGSEQIENERRKAEHDTNRKAAFDAFLSPKKDAKTPINRGK